MKDKCSGNDTRKGYVPLCRFMMFLVLSSAFIVGCASSGDTGGGSKVKQFRDVKLTDSGNGVVYFYLTEKTRSTNHIILVQDEKQIDSIVKRNVMDQKILDYPSTTIVYPTSYVGYILPSGKHKFVGVLLTGGSSNVKLLEVDVASGGKQYYRVNFDSPSDFEFVQEDEAVAKPGIAGCSGGNKDMTK